MRRLAAGEVDLLGKLYALHGSAVLRRLGCLVTDTSPAEADDLCQEVFLTAYRIAGRYRETGQLRSWLLGIAFKKARGWQRKRWLRMKLMLGFTESEVALARGSARPSPESALLAKERYAAALSTLPQGLRTVLLMHAGDKLSGQEIADILGLKVNAVWTRLHRARAAVSRALGDAAPIAGAGGKP